MERKVNLFMCKEQNIAMLANINSLALVACERHSGRGFSDQENTTHSLLDGFSDVNYRII